MPALQTAKRRVHEVLEVAAPGDRVSRVVDLAIVALIVASSTVLILETVPGLLEGRQAQARAFEAFSIGVFTVEYLLRLWSVEVDPRYSRPVLGRLNWAATPAALIDLLAIVPFYLPLVGVNLVFLRVLRIFRLARVFKAGRYSASLRTLGDVLREKRTDLLSALAVTLALILVAASLMYYAERDVQPERYSSIPMAVWWVIVTLSGNADVLPQTFLGRVLGSVTSVLGIGLFALPAGILASGFSARLNERDRRRTAPREAAEDERRI